MLPDDDMWLTNTPVIGGAICESATFNCTAMEFTASPTDPRQRWGTTSSDSHRACSHTEIQSAPFISSLAPASEEKQIQILHLVRILNRPEMQI